MFLIERILRVTWATVIMLTLTAAISEAQEDVPAPSSYSAAFGGGGYWPNLVKLPSRCIAIITDRTVDGDAGSIQEVAEGVALLEDCNSWQDADYRIACACPAGAPFNGLILSGHGSFDGGVKSSGGNLLASNITEGMINSLQTILTPDAPIYILACSQGSHPDQMQQLADETGHPVVANTSCVYGGNKGDGEWNTFYPVAWTWKDDLATEVHSETRYVQ